MTTLVEIPGGQATLREKLSVGQRRRIERARWGAMALLSDVDIPADALREGPDQVAAATQIKITKQGALDLEEARADVDNVRLLVHLESWTLASPLPTAETIEDMDEDVFNALIAEIEKLPPPPSFGFTPVGVDSPTAGSPSSNGQSKEGQRSTPTPKSSTSTARTAGESSSPE